MNELRWNKSRHSSEHLKIKAWRDEKKMNIYFEFISQQSGTRECIGSKIKKRISFHFIISTKLLNDERNFY
jgi:hypothetical protein